MSLNLLSFLIEKPKGLFRAQERATQKKILSNYLARAAGPVLGLGGVRGGNRARGAGDMRVRCPKTSPTKRLFKRVMANLVTWEFLLLVRLG